MHIKNNYPRRFHSYVLFFYCLSITLLLLSCRDVPVVQDEEKRISIEMTGKEATEAVNDSRSQLSPNTGPSGCSIEQVTLYDFNDLKDQHDCYFQQESDLSTTYRDLQFASEPFWATCNGTIRTAHDAYAGAYTTDRIILPAYATKVSLEMILYEDTWGGLPPDSSALVIYDEDGNELERQSPAGYNSWQLITLSSPTPIAYIGIHGHNPSLGFDNLTVHYLGQKEPPVAVAGPDSTIEATGPLTPVTLDGTDSYDPQGDELQYTWSLEGTVIDTSAQTTVDLELGTYVFTLTVDDGTGCSFSDEVTRTVQDTTPPELYYTIENTEVWPVDHQLKLVVSGVRITDLVDPDPLLEINVTSNETSRGNGANNDKPDWEIRENTNGSFDIYVRAERNHRGESREYEITLRGTDASGNMREEAITVTVPDNQGVGPSK